MRKKEPKTPVEEPHEGSDRKGLEGRSKVEALDAMFAESENHPYKFIQQWVSPLTEAGLSFDSALAVLIEGHFQPN